MNKRQKEILQSQLNNEKKTLNELKQVYTQALKDCEKKIAELSSRKDMENLQSIIYQKQYQQALKGQLTGVLEQLHSNEFATISDYLTRCYQEGYIGVMYDLAGQGIPIIMPIDQEQVSRAIQIDSKLKKSLYDSLGEDINKLKTSIRAEVSRGIANGSSWNDVAGQLAQSFKNTPFNRAYNNSIRIARTEGHRIQNQSALDAQKKAKSKGADVVKQWDSTLDGATRDTHRLLDGQIREVDEPFEVEGKKADAPGMFGDPAEDCNCRCCLLQRARWALDDKELEVLREKASFHGLLVDDSKEYGHEKAKDFADFKEKYLIATKDNKDNKEQKNIAKNPNINYNSSSTYIAYKKSIESGELTPLADFELYERISNEIDKKIVGTTTTNGIDIKSKSDHFIARVIGSVEQRRNGVPINSIVSILKKPDYIGDVEERKSGKSQRFVKYGVGTVTVNPITGNLIQVNPLKAVNKT